MTIGWFYRDPKLAMMQTLHHFFSPDPFERNLGTSGRIPNEGELFYGLVQTATTWNATFFCGFCAVRRPAATGWAAWRSRRSPRMRTPR